MSDMQLEEKLKIATAALAVFAEAYANATKWMPDLPLDEKHKGHALVSMINDVCFDDFKAAALAEKALRGIA